MPDANGNIQGISVPELPWRRKPTDAEVAILASGMGDEDIAELRAAFDEDACSCGFPREECEGCES